MSRFRFFTTAENNVYADTAGILYSSVELHQLKNSELDIFFSDGVKLEVNPCSSPVSIHTARPVTNAYSLKFIFRVHTSPIRTRSWTSMYVDCMTCPRDCPPTAVGWPWRYRLITPGRRHGTGIGLAWGCR